MTPYVLGFGLMKLAITRWQREGLAEGMTPEQIKAKRQAMWESGTILDDAALARHRAMRSGQTQAIAKMEGVEQPIPGDPAGVYGPRLKGDRVVLPTDSAHFVRQSASPPTGSFLDPTFSFPGGALVRKHIVSPKTERMYRIPQEISETSAVDPSLEHAAMQHEFGERAARRAALAKEVGARRIGSHLSETPLVAERSSLFMDPEANQIIDAWRMPDAENAFVVKKMRQMGHTHAQPMPLGGKAHRALSDAVLEHRNLSPETLTLRRRDAFEPLESAERWASSKMLPPRWREALSGIEQEVGHVPGAIPRSMSSRARQIESGLGEGLNLLGKAPLGNLQRWVDAARSGVKKLFQPAHLAGTPETFMRRLSTVR